MKKELSCCGYRCDLCAARSDDSRVRQKLVDGWRKYFGHKHYTVENVRCDGCLHNGRLADKNCPVRACVMERKLKNCAYCIEFPCKLLKKVMCSRKELQERFGDIPEEDFNLCMRQFISYPVLMKIWKDLGNI